LVAKRAICECDNEEDSGSLNEITDKRRRDLEELEKNLKNHKSVKTVEAEANNTKTE
jgi:hypothetical protein